ncbi:hypothetical protein [Neorhizobium sp. IRS_2294]|uniref:hypothetical protein n=1 Tax=unclassified Neorhizobium TaxID=2629175 RepID=UPI003D2C201A
MRNVDPDFMAALADAPERGIVPRKLVSITAREFGHPTVLETVSFWTGDENVDITVTSGVDSQPSTRLFYGGVNLEIGSIPRVSNLTIQTVPVSISQLADPVQQLVRGYDVRLGKVEIWDMLLDPATRLPVGTPQLVFFGEVDGSPIDTPSVGGEGLVTIRCVSDAISMLTRKNYTKSSYEAQKLRGGDEWGKYANTVKTWRIPWGQKL